MIRLRRMDLVRFGPFTGAAMDLSASRDLEIVIGANEAGKSSALRAWADLLFGIRKGTADDFRHAKPDLRLEAILDVGSSEPLHVRRHRRDKEGLTDLHDAPISETLLATHLHGVARAEFESVFALDQERLRRGGRSLLESDGDAGEVLFSAGSGVTHLHKLRAALRSEADAIFVPRGRTKKLNEQLAALERAESQLANATLPGERWVDANSRVERAQAELQTLRHRARTVQAERARLERIVRGRAAAAKRVLLEQRLAGLPDVPLLEEDFAATRATAHARREGLTTRVAEAEATLAACKSALAELVVDDARVAARDHTDALVRRLASYREAKDRLPRLVEQREAASASARAALEDGGRAIELHTVPARRPPKRDRKRIEALADEILSDARMRAEKLAEIAQVERELERLRARNAANPAPQAVPVLELAVGRIERLGDLDEQLSLARVTFDATTREAAAAAARLAPWTGDPASLAALAVPSEPTIDRFEVEAASLAERASVVTRRVSDARARLAAIDVIVRELVEHRHVPTEEELALSRRHRDEGWSHIARLWRSGQIADDRLAAWSAGAAPESAFETSMRASDDVADRLRREAAAVAQLASARSEREVLVAQLVHDDAEAEEISRARGDWDRRWRDAWRGCGFEPASPPEMRAWLERHRAAVASVVRLSLARAAFDAAVERLARSRSDLAGAMGAGPTSHGSVESLSSLLDVARRRVADVQERLSAHEAALAQESSLCEKLDALRDQLERSSELGRERRAEWSQGVAPFGFGPDSTPSEVRDAMTAIDAAHEQLSRAEEIERSIDETRSVIAAFEVDAAALVQSILPDARDLAIDIALEATAREVAIATDAARQRVRERESIREQELALTILRGELATADAGWNALLARAQCADLPSLLECERLSRERRAATDELRMLERQWSDGEGGADVRDLAKEVESEDATTLDARIDALVDESERVEIDRERAEGERTAAQTVLAAMTGSAEAAALREQVEGHLARTRASTEKYLRAEIAALVLTRAIEAFRARRQNPVLDEAGRAFGSLTCGSFTDLKVRVSETGDAQEIVGVRPNGSTCRVDEMSEGTRDQVYLALRYAVVVAHVRAGTRIPVLFDDVLVNFDDERASAAVKLFADLGRETQVVYFTHHPHVADLARAALGSDRVGLHALDRGG